MRHDSDQEQAIQANRNVVVRAGAGAGKTSVLVERYVRLVQDGVPVDRILSLTFTRKAAAEMHERIHRRLAELASDGVESAGRELGRMDTAVISTLDSFCAAVARSGCSAFGVPPTFSVEEAAVGRFAESLSLRFLMARYHDDGEAAEVLLSLIRLNRFDRLWRNGFATLARDHFLAGRMLDLDAQVDLQRGFLVRELTGRSREVADELQAILRLEGRARCLGVAQETIEAVGFDTESVEQLARDFEGCVPGDIQRQMLDSIARLVGQLDRLGAIQMKCGASKEPDVLEFKDRFKRARSDIGTTRELLLTIRAWPRIVGSMAIASEFQSTVVAEKRRTGILSYHDVVTLAIAVLRDDQDLRRYYKNRFRSIMIDEFQDNNDEQRELLYLLAERTDVSSPGIPAAADLDPGKLFFVGDEKQSIYRFRGADVSVFKGLSSDLGPSAAPITLAHNYRSEPGLIAFFNALFPAVFDNPDPGYEASFTPLESRAPVAGIIPSARLWLVPKSEDGSLSTDDAEAYQVAAFIRGSVAEGSLLVPDLSVDPVLPRPAGYSDFAILLRSTGNQLRFERMLRLLGVPYTSQTARSLFLEAPINDLASVLQLVLYPNDRVALAAYLRSPLVGLSDAGLVLALSQQGLFTDIDGLTESDRLRYEIARERYEEMLRLADTERLTTLVYHFWYIWGYRYHLLKSPDNHPYLEHYDYIYELARIHEDRGLAAFLRTIRNSAGRNERVDELTVLGEETHGVQIMTIHKAKGLEFPVVIVANTGNRGRTGGISDAPFYDSGQGLVFNVAGESGTPKEKAVNAIYRLERDQAQLEDAAELRRLLYVAATRATTHLLVTGHLRGNDSSMLSMLAEPFRMAADEVSDRSDLELEIRELDPVPQTVQYGAGRPEWNLAELASAYLARRPENLSGAELRPRRTFTATELNSVIVEAAETGGASDRDVPETGRSDDGTGPDPLIIDGPAAGLETDFGTFVHHCIEMLGSGRDRESVVNPVFLPSSIRPDLDGDELTRFLHEGRGLAEGFLASAVWSGLAGAQATFELPFIMRLGPDEDPIRVRGKMDFVAVTADRVVIIDFKTDRHVRAAHYFAQLALYRRAAASIFGMDAESFLFDLRRGISIAVDDDVPDRTLSSAVSSIRAHEISRRVPV